MTKSKSQSAPRTTGRKAKPGVPEVHSQPTPLEAAAQVAAVLHPTPDAVLAAQDAHPEASPLEALVAAQCDALDAVLASLTPDAEAGPTDAELAALEAEAGEPTPEPDAEPTPEPVVEPALDDTEAAWEAADTALTAADDAKAALDTAAAECQATAEAAAAAGTTVPTADQTRASLATDALAAQAAALRIEATAAAVVAEYVRLERDSRGTHPTIGRVATEHVAAVLASRGKGARGEAVKAVMARASHASGTTYTPQHLSRCMAVWGCCRIWGTDLVSALPVGVQKALATLVERQDLPGSEGHAEHYVPLPHVADHAAALVAYCLTPRQDGAVPAHIRDRLPRSGATARYVHSVPGVNGSAMALAEPVAKLCTELARYSDAKAAGKTATDPFAVPAAPALPASVVAAVDKAVAAVAADRPAAVTVPAAGPANPGVPSTVAKPDATAEAVAAAVKAGLVKDPAAPTEAEVIAAVAMHKPAAEATAAEATAEPAAEGTLAPTEAPTLDAAEAEAEAEAAVPARHGEQGLAIPVWNLPADPGMGALALMSCIRRAHYQTAEATLFTLGADDDFTLPLLMRVVEGALVGSDDKGRFLKELTLRLAVLADAVAKGKPILCPEPAAAK